MRLYKRRKSIMAFYLLGDCIREQRERLGVTQEELCEGICSVPTLSKIENGKQGMRLNQYIAIMERLGLPVEPLGVRVTNDEMYWYNIKREIRHRLASQKEDVEELLDELKNCPIGMDNMTEQYITFVRAGLRREKAGFDDEMLELLLHAIHCTYRNFDINQVNSVKLLTTDEILIINCIASVLRKQGKTMQAIMWQKFLKEYLEHSNADYDEIVNTYPLILFNLSNLLMECKKYNEALELCSTGIEYCNKHGKLNMFMQLLYNKSICLAECGDKKQAAQFMTTACIIAKARGDEHRAAIIDETFDEYKLDKLMP